MKALTVQPGVADSTRLEALPEPIITENTLLVEGHAIMAPHLPGNRG
jgi:hypothetical protein